MKKIHIAMSGSLLPVVWYSQGKYLEKAVLLKKSTLRKDIQQANVDMLREMHIEPTALDNGFAPVDIDVTPFDNSKSNKEGVSRTYKGFDGYAPIMAYIGTEGYLVNLELWIGKQHCQKETPDFLRETIELCRQLTEKPLLIRLDSGNDALKTQASLWKKAINTTMCLSS